MAKRKKTSDEGKVMTGLSRYDSGSLKSGVQKYVRRGEVEKALAAAKAFVEKDSEGLLRRLPIIITEDCGWQKVWLLPEIKKIYGERRDISEEELTNAILRVVRIMAEGKKDKDTCGLYDEAQWAMSHGEHAEFTGIRDFDKLLNDEGIVEAAMIVCQEASENAGASPIWPILKRRAEESGLEGAGDVVEAAKWRSAAGTKAGFDQSVLALACLQMVVFNKDGWVGKNLWKEVVPEVNGNITSLDWYCLDGHTYIGKIALSTVIRRMSLPLTYRDLHQAMFYLESAKCNELIPQRWFKWWEREIPYRLKISKSELEGSWAELSKHVKGCVEWLKEQRGLT